MDDELRALLAAQARLIAELSERIAPVRIAALPLSDLFAQYEVAQKARPGWRTAKSMLTPVLKLLGARDAGALTVRDWTEYRDSRAELAPSSRNYTLFVLKAMLRWGVAEGLLAAESPLCRARTQPQKDHRETAPTEDDVTRLLAEVRQPRERVIVLCAVDSGMRRNEIRQLQWSWVDRDRLEIALPNWACKNHRGGIVPMTARLRGAIEAMPRVLRSPYVLANPKTGEPYAREMLTKWWRELADLAGLKAEPGEVRVRLHDGRHAYVTQALERGVRLEVVSDVVRHASLDQTIIYRKRRPNDLRAARETFEAGIVRDTSKSRP